MNHLRILLLLCVWSISGYQVSAQSNNCSGAGSDADTTYTGAIFATYGSVTNAVNNKYSTSGSLGQTFVGLYFSQEYHGTAGFYSSFLLPPLPPILTATQGDLLDRIQLNWAVDPLSPAASEGFNIYRDGIFLANVGRGIRTYNDFNVIAGRPYNYTVRGVNIFGEGFAGHALGFQVPNGVVTGWVQTPSGSPVPNALITLTPMQGFSARFGPADGGYADTTGSGLASLLPTADKPWTLTFWIKTTQATADAGILQLQPVPFNIRPLASAGGQEGIAVDAGGAPFLTGAFPDSTKNDWHHVALTFDGTQYRLYLDGSLTALAPGAAISTATALHIGASTDSTGSWEGYLDELRVYHRLLDELDFGEVMDGTASSLTPGLQFYWKMDEEQGTKSFDLIRRNQLYFCGASFDADRPPVRIAGVTNEEGYYRIESASYGTGTTFLAHPSKYFYKHRALKFVRAENDYAELPDFALPDKATIELWVNSAGTDGEQCLLSKRWGSSSFALLLKQNGTDNNIIFNFNGTNFPMPFGQLGMGYQHLALALDGNGASRTVTVYRNGTQQGPSMQFPVTGNFSDSSYHWIAGARDIAGGLTDHFGGLIDEIAVYDSLLTPATLLEHAQNSRDPQERGLRVYFPFDEGNGTRLNNIGALLTGPGQTAGTEWTAFAPNQSVTPHIFTPASRQVTLNPSVTSVDQVDFVDRSTVPVAGYVRYTNTDCFAPNVEILVNGASYNPAIFTDSTGRFIIDFDPGATATLLPKLADHQFVPASWEVTNVVSPIAGILFNDVTTRTVKGQVAGGLCKKSIIKAPPGQGQGTFAVVKIRSTDGCLERQLTIDNQEGEFEFLDVPPLDALTVAVVEHSDLTIKAAFQVEGGVTVNISEKDTIVDFIYFAPPEVVLQSGLDPVSPTCATIVLDQYEPVTLEIKLAEQYIPIKDTNGDITDDGTCYLDTAAFTIINGFSDAVHDTTMSGGLLKYKFRVGSPNPSHPYLKTLQIIGTTLDDREGSLTKQAVVTGIRTKENTFTTQLPEVPILILRDPPGDGSSSFWEKNNKVCQTLGTELKFTDGLGNIINVDNAPDVKIVTSAFGGPIIETETKIGGEIAASLIFRTQIEGSFEVCLSAKERIATSANDLIVGSDADVYVGLGTNVSVGLADEVTFNPDSCLPNVKELIAVEPLSATTFLYSQFHIKNNVIRYLDAIIQNDDLQLDSTELAGYVQSRDLWASFLKDNDSLKTKARFLKNLSFDAGTDYENSITSTETNSASLGTYVDSEGHRRVFAGGSFNSVGVNTELKFTYSTTEGFSSTDNQYEGITVGYALSDDDPGNAFTIDVAMDTVYNTPVFNLVAGQSSCPWESGTANRDAPNLALAQGSQYVATNVPSHEPAVFQFNLGNLSASNEDRTYGFTAISANNPHGAIIRLNGTPLNNNTIRFLVPFGSSIPVTLTVERGVIEYDYDSLLVVLYSECELDRAYALGITPDPMFFSPIYLGAHFIRPCSEVDINVPEQDWVIYPNNPGMPGTEMRITVSGYNKNEPYFERVRVQYRPSDGDGAWINIAPKSDVLKDSLGDIFTHFYWETSGLSDGPYEVRAVAICSGDASDRPGYSKVIKGRIDRQPPNLVGVPEPSDGVYNVGDEISFTFNKEINCSKLIPDDLNQPNNVGLYYATTGQLIDIAVTCYENKITLDPSFNNKAFENHILRAELHDIQDKTGNTLSFEKWEFYVDRNELAWLTDSIGMTKYENETKTVIAKIHNRGGYPVPFTITDLPDWVHVVPDKGTLAANEIRDIRFEVDSSLAFGLWTDSITLHTETGQNPFFMGGDEPLPIGVRVVCRPPDWDIDAGLYENTMNMVLRLNIEGEFSTDVEDMVVAYIDDELRGRAYVAYAPEVDDYLAYLTIYGNPADVDKPIRLEVWDASACLRYGEVQEEFTFQPNMVIGFPTAPTLVQTNSLVRRDIPLGNGWNWLSFNLLFPDNSLDAALAALKNPAGDLIRSQTDFATYSGSNWNGTLTNLGNTTMYIYRTDKPDTIKMLGTLINPLSTSIPLVAGWNWIGYIPNYALPIDDALTSLAAQPGDVIKSQVAFAQYLDDTYAWVGNLKFLQPPHGYQVKLTNPGVLNYPPKPFTDSPILERDKPMANFWTVDPTQFEFGMTLIGALEESGINKTTATMELGAFAGSEVRGAAQAIYIESLNAYQFFLTCYANTNGELLHFKLYDSATGEVWNLAETMYFAADLHQGTIAAPVPFSLLSMSTNSAVFVPAFEIRPNPFTTETMFRITLPHAQDIALTVYDGQGREVSGVHIYAAEGLNVFRWNGLSNTAQHLNPGVYVVRLQTETGIVSKKVVLQR